MTLDQTEENNTMLIDMNIPAAADDSGVPTWASNDSAYSIDATSYRE